MLDNDINKCQYPRIMLSAINGGSGKTFISTGIIAALRARGYKVQAYKKGPDYIDIKWHSLSSGRSCYNLDMFLFPEQVMSKLIRHSMNIDISIIEGNHGLYDSMDDDGFGSTAYLSRYTKTPVILIVNCYKMSRSVAALVNGFVDFEKGTNIAGVILNQVSGERHEHKITEAIKKHCKIPVIGVVRKTNRVDLEQRHLGIITTEDKILAEQAVVELKNIAESSIDIEKIIDIAGQAGIITDDKPAIATEIKTDDLVTIAVARDNAFNFYYPDNLEALEQQGARLLYFSPIYDKEIPTADGLYIGGGYPEFYARELDENMSMKKSIENFINRGFPTFAECGGMMYMTEKIIWNNEEFDMIGLIKAHSVMHKKPQGKGYVELKTVESNTDRPSLWNLPAGTITRAHEFHYSSLENLNDDTQCLFELNRGTGIIHNCDGIIYKNMLATYSHFHCLAAPWWAPTFVQSCIDFRRSLQ